MRSRLIPQSLKNQAYSFLYENQDKLLFVMGTGRSGTQLISNLLGSSQEAMVFHEPNFNEDVGTMDILRRDQELANRYWRHFRSVEIYRRWLRGPRGVMYCEVNGTIRYQAQAIKYNFPEARMLLMVRDGRSVVRSVMERPQFYGPHSKGAFALKPLPGDPFEAEFPTMNRFEKICWSWRDANEFLIKHVPTDCWISLERLVTDYDYFLAHLTNNKLNISYKTWNELTSQKSKNSTRDYVFPSYESWSKCDRESFNRICGETNEKLGYMMA